MQHRGWSLLLLPSLAWLPRRPVKPRRPPVGSKHRHHDAKAKETPLPVDQPRWKLLMPVISFHSLAAGASERMGTQSATAERLPPAVTNRHCAMGEMSLTSAVVVSGKEMEFAALREHSGHES
jgi:hypothetical protein